MVIENINLRRKQKLICNDALLVVQHPSIYTLGRGATVDNIKFTPSSSSSHEVVRVERGGEVTWHGPGQIVAYPLFDLNKHRKDLHWFANSLEQTVINLLRSHHAVVGERSQVNTGVWVGRDKISAIGVTASRWITMHGIALNVSCDLTHFEQIVPCGVAAPDRGVCSVQSVAQRQSTGLAPSGGAVRVEEVAEHWVGAFAEVFGLDLAAHGEDRLQAMMADFPDIAELEPDRILL